MAIDDPFFDPQDEDDRTRILRPVPGGHIPPEAAAPESKAPSFNAQPLPRLGRLNPLEQAASGILALLPQLKQAQKYAFVEPLRQKMIAEIQSFQNQALQSGIEQSTVYAARYVLCTTIDEFVLNTPWGSHSSWSQQNLLSTFHQEVSGGERFFQWLKKFAQTPHRYLDLLELMYLCLALGFKGHYRIVAGGSDKLNQIQEWLYQLIRREKGEPERELSPHWQGVKKQHHLIDRLPSWVVGSSLAAVLGLIFFTFLIQLNQLSDPVVFQLHSIQAKPMQATVSPPPLQPLPAPVISTPPLSLAQLLAEDIKKNQVQVKESDKKDTAIVQSDQLFRSGSARVNAQLIPLLKRIGMALDQLSGPILITGHTDSIPIRTARFPSNWHLSKARAQAVAEIIRPQLSDPDRVRIEGKADLEPVASNQTAQGRAKNRRVEISLLK